jgi:hypothetical protein
MFASAVPPCSQAAAIASDDRATLGHERGGNIDRRDAIPFVGGCRCARVMEAAASAKIRRKLFLDMMHMSSFSSEVEAVISLIEKVGHSEPNLPFAGRLHE